MSRWSQMTDYSQKLCGVCEVVKWSVFTHALTNAQVSQDVCSYSGGGISASVPREGYSATKRECVLGKLRS